MSLDSVKKKPPEHIGASFLKDRLLVFVEQVSGIEHVEEVEFGVNGDRCLHPGHVGSRALLDSELLKWMETVTYFLGIYFIKTNIIPRLRSKINLQILPLA